MLLKKLKQVFERDKWSAVAEELEQEKLKLMSYDSTLLQAIKISKGTKVLDYGAGPGVLAYALQKLGCDVKTFDISREMNRLCAEKIGAQNVYTSAGQVPDNAFDCIICNLVLCINPEDEVLFISRKISEALKQDGEALIGFCNPKIFDFPESALDFRMPSGKRYEDNHVYRKIKKEGNYEILESHRPLDWYEDAFREAGLEVRGIIFTPEYEFAGRKANDFVIFRVAKRPAQKDGAVQATNGVSGKVGDFRLRPDLLGFFPYLVKVLPDCAAKFPVLEINGQPLVSVRGIVNSYKRLPVVHHAHPQLVDSVVADLCAKPYVHFHLRKARLCHKGGNEPHLHAALYGGPYCGRELRVKVLVGENILEVLCGIFHKAVREGELAFLARKNAYLFMEPPLAGGPFIEQKAARNPIAKLFVGGNL